MIEKSERMGIFRTFCRFESTGMATQFRFGWSADGWGKMKKIGEQVRKHETQIYLREEMANRDYGLF
jgi:hypothetical protein